jgi:SPP1 family predicted phage head-tail adaptor
MTHAFALDKQVTLQAKTAERTALNAPVNTWVNVLPGAGKAWARISDLTGRQYAAAGGVKNYLQTEITLRRRPDLIVLPSMRVVHAGFAYDIEAVLARDQHWLTLMCRKEPLDG